MLQELSQQAYFLAVATGKSRVGLNRAMNAVKLLSLFDATRCADETFSKPHPAMLQELTRELGQDMRRTVMIGDTSHDLLMATMPARPVLPSSMGRIPWNSCRRASPCIRRPRWPSCING
jgi:phosphoglycolate phosphatase